AAGRGVGAPGGPENARAISPRPSAATPASAASHTHVGNRMKARLDVACPGLSPAGATVVGCSLGGAGMSTGWPHWEHLARFPARPARALRVLPQGAQA